jgi:hypothetical protein
MVQNHSVIRSSSEGWYPMPKHPPISIPLDIPDARVLQTELTKDGEFILTVESTLTSTICRRCGRVVMHK